jgi:hypothetical protein
MILAPAFHFVRQHPIALRSYLDRDIRKAPFYPAIGNHPHTVKLKSIQLDPLAPFRPDQQAPLFLFSFQFAKPIVDLSNRGANPRISL